MVSDGKRALAYIVTIDEIRPIANYDRVVHARTNGWWCVVRKDEFNVGDRAIYFEIDSKVPETDERFAFLESKHYKIKTQKMCKVLSQGLLMPANLFPEVNDLDIGADVTDLLGVKYYVPEDNARKAAKPDPKAKYKSMAARHKELFRKPFIRKLMKREWGRKLLFFFFGKKKDKPLAFPTKFPYVHKTDEERCLIGDTKIQTNIGTLRIADIVNKELPVEVLSYNHKTKNIEFKPILSYQCFNKSDDEDLIEIKYPYRFGNQKTNTIRCTPDHKFFNGEEYVRADSIKVGDNIFIHHKCYSDKIIPIVFGMLLGDSGIKYDKRNKSSNVSISTSQGEKQLDYLKFKLSLFGEKYSKIYQGKSGYCDNIVYQSFIALDYTISKAILENCFIDKKFKVTPEMIEYLTPLSLAIWYMDDGSLKHKYDNNCSPSIMISTCSLTKEENLLLIDMLKNKYGVECNLRKEKGKYWSIYITTKGTPVFLKLVTKYMPKSMRYKTLTEYENEYFSINELTFDKNERLLPVPVVSIDKYKGIRKYKTVFDIEVKDNHNFFANNILTHNCENMPWVLGLPNAFTVCEKLDGCSASYILERKGKRKFEFYVLSRNVRQLTPDQECYHDENIYWNNAFKYDIENVLKSYLNAFPELDYVCIQGEAVGKVQGNPLKLDEDDLYIFNFIRSDRGRLPSVEAKEIVESLGMKFVPILDTNYHIPNDMETFKKYATAPSAINPNVLREGVVLRDQTNDMSFKNVSNEYLLKHHS